MTDLVPIRVLVDALPIEPFALRALLAVESFCLCAMVVMLMILAVQLLYGCMKTFTVASLVVCFGIAVCGVLSFLTLEWHPGLIATGVVLALHMMGSDPMRRASIC
jgi:hypothetical protein